MAESATWRPDPVTARLIREMRCDPSGGPGRALVPAGPILGQEGDPRNRRRRYETGAAKRGQLDEHLQVVDEARVEASPPGECAAVARAAPHVALAAMRAITHVVGKVTLSSQVRDRVASRGADSAYRLSPTDAGATWEPIRLAGCLHLVEAVAETRGRARAAASGSVFDAAGGRGPAIHAVAGASVWRWSFIRLWVAVIRRHSVRAADLPRR